MLLVEFKPAAYRHSNGLSAELLALITIELLLYIAVFAHIISSQQAEILAGLAKCKDITTVYNTYEHVAF